METELPTAQINPFAGLSDGANTGLDVMVYAELEATIPFAVTAITPAVMPAGVIAVIEVAEFTVYDAAFTPLNVTLVTFVKFVPAMVTLVPPPLQYGP